MRGQRSRLAAHARGDPPRSCAAPLARADQGKALSLDEVEALLGARGDDLDRLMASPAGCATSATATS